ncbi:MAG: DUF2493 domain-containing protein [Oscillospiraceae bacterium]|nr:DUF2493 domain-containing protein [Oscillospiraceae bacterium]
MRVAIVGSRDIAGREEYWYDKICGSIPRNCTEIVSGGADGIDTLARRYAKENKLMLKEFLPEYKIYGKSAAFVRNTQIVEYAHIVLAFWDGKSRGTADTIAKCCNLNKPVEIYL